MFDVLIAFILLSLIIASEVKDYKRKAAKKREREEEREIIRKIKAEDNKNKLTTEFGKKYNIDLKKLSTHNYETHKIIPIL